MLTFRTWLKSWRNRRRLVTRRQLQRVQFWLLTAVMVALSSLGGWLLSAPNVSEAAQPPAQSVSGSGTVDVVPPELQLAQETYLARCTTCHMGIPPAVMPTESWKAILEDDNHYGVPWTPLKNPDLSLAWKYTRTFSRALNPNETTPYRIARSRYFKILHPKVAFTEPIAVGTCISCHPGARQFNYRTLTTEWQSAP
ncbi:MAG TPA: diheme cytochrome C [Stenomitos sp.]